MQIKTAAAHHGSGLFACGGAAQGDKAAVKAYYRLVDKPDDLQVMMDAILAPHRKRGIQRMRG